MDCSFAVHLLGNWISFFGCFAYIKIVPLVTAFSKNFVLDWLQVAHDTKSSMTVVTRTVNYKIYSCTVLPPQLFWLAHCAWEQGLLTTRGYTGPCTADREHNLGANPFRNHLVFPWLFSTSIYVTALEEFKAGLLLVSSFLVLEQALALASAKELEPGWFFSHISSGEQLCFVVPRSRYATTRLCYERNTIAVVSPRQWEYQRGAVQAHSFRDTGVKKLKCLHWSYDITWITYHFHVTFLRNNSWGKRVILNIFDISILKPQKSLLLILYVFRWE